ncbi:MAG: hypothetical protein ACR2P5_05000 [Gammaproteobacteria bacterium]
MSFLRKQESRTAAQAAPSVLAAKVSAAQKRFNFRLRGIAGKKIMPFPQKQKSKKPIFSAPK